MSKRFGWYEAGALTDRDEPLAFEEQERQFRRWQADLIEAAREAVAAGMEPAAVLEHLRSLAVRSRTEKEP